MSTILIADDVAALRAHLSDLLRETLAGPTEILEAANGLEAIDIFMAYKPAMVVMDISMPELNGIKSAQKIWAEVPSTRILFCSQFDGDAYVRELDKITPPEAIYGYAIKGESDEKLRQAMRSVFVQGNLYIDPTLTGAMNSMDTPAKSPAGWQYDTLADAIIGLRDRAAAARHAISGQGFHNLAASLTSELGNKEQIKLQRAAQIQLCDAHISTVVTAFKQGLVSVEDLLRFEQELAEWLADELAQRRSA
jgi:DNA-binding NarL/FixJ family response regulator